MLIKRENESIECYRFQRVTKETLTPQMKTSRMLERPWQDLAVDLVDTLPTGESLLVLVERQEDGQV